MSATYFSFITLTSIGFGDLVPLKTFGDHKTIWGQIKVVITTVYFIAGIVCSMVSQKLENAHTLLFYQSTMHCSILNMNLLKNAQDLAAY